MWLFRGGSSSSSRHDDEYESSSYDSQEYDNSDELWTSEEEDGDDDDEYEEENEEQQEHEEEINDEEPYEIMDDDDDDDDDSDDEHGDVSTNERDSSDNDDERAETNDSRLSKQDEETNDGRQQQNGGRVEEQEQQQEKVVHGQYGEETKGRETTTSRSCNDETLENDVDNMDDKRSGEDLAHDESEEEEEISDDESDDESESDDEEDDDDAITSLREKQALLALAAENDRVDIIKAILTDQDKNVLLHPTTTATATDNANVLPPLHVAISYGSTNATSCLLRMGANPAVRLPPGNHGGLSAWELLWNDSHNHRHRTVSPSKQQGMLHAFTAEALRCIGSDEVERLQHLLDSGMPMTTEIGDKDLYGWSVEMAALKCQQVLKPPPLAENDDEQQQQQQQDDDDKVRHREGGQTQTTTASSSSSFSSGTVVSRLGRAGKNDSEWSLQHNRLEELESLGRALSVCLDNLAEEVSVCHGLLLLGGGASALASHVRSLKVLKEKREVELEKWTLDWEDGQDELAYWLQQSGGSDGFDDFSMTMTMMETTDAKSLEKKRSFTTPENKDEEEAQRRQLKAQIAASENKVRKLRASIADLSEENARDLVEVEKRGLSGGIKLVRTLREELREVEFHLSEAKSGTASCRARVNLIVARLEGEKKNGNHADANDAASSPAAAAAASESRSAAPNGETNGRQERALSSLFADDDDTPSSSDKIASGDSEAIALRPAGGNRGYLPIDLWDIILRIIGLGRVAVKKSVRDNTPSAMII